MANNQLLASKIVVAEEEPKLRAIPAAATAIIAAVGVCERGPIRTPTLVQSWEEFLRIFGSFTTDGDLPTAVYGIYRQNPGASVWVSRTVHYTDITNASSYTAVVATVNVPGTSAVASAGAVTGVNTGPWNLEHAQTLDIHCDEDAGGPDTATFNGVEATIAGGAPSLPPTLGDTMTVQVDTEEDDQVITWAGSETTIALVAQKINETVRGFRAVVNGSNVDLVTDTQGTDASIEVTGQTGTGASDVGHTVTSGSPTTGTGNVGNIDAVTAAEAISIIEAAVVNPATGVTVTEEATGELTITSNTTGTGSSVQVESSSTATGFGFDNNLHSGSASSSVTTLVLQGKTPGTYAHDLRLEVADAANDDSDYFNLLVKTSAGVVLEVWPNLQVSDDTADDFVEAIINNENTGSNYIEAVDQAEAVRPDNGTYTPASGDDGLTSLDDNDFIGDQGGQTGMYAFDSVQVITLLVVPGRATSAVHQAIVTYCESDRQGECFGILDPPSGYTAAQMVTYVVTTAALKNLSEHAAIYWPQIKVLNPSKTIFGSDEQITVPPAGWVAGVVSRVDAARPGGQYDPPAGIERGRIYGCLGFETDDVLREEVRDLVYPERINPIASSPGFPRFIDGVWTLKANGNFPSISERRAASYIERQVKSGLQFARHSNNDEALRADAYRTTYAFLRAQMQLGAFRSQNPSEAFYVDFSDALNTPDVIAQYKLVGRIGLATQKPAEYITLLFSQDTRAIEEALAE